MYVKPSHNRPPLESVPLETVLPFRAGLVYIRMSVGHWDALLQAAYDTGSVLLELDDAERLVGAYRQRGVVRPEDRN
jgi:hypothetical protein